MKIDIGTNEHVTIAKNGTDICNLDQLDNIIVDELVDLGLYSLPPDPPRYLTFTANQDNSTMRIDKNGTPYELLNADIKYSTDGGTTWNDYTFTNADGQTITLNNGQSVKFKGNNAKFSIDGTYYYRFFLSGSFAGSGDVTSLLNGVGGNARITDYCFNNLFSGSMALTTAPALPATTLGSYCYYCMFKGCSSLTTAPELPATTLASNCYSYMFSGCSSLTTAPALPATTLGSNCYSYMFQNCTSLATAPELPATTLANNCYYYMFKGCSSLTTAPELPATTLATSCYYYMFNGCTSLTTAPELPAITLASYCYNGMFKNCSALTTAPTLPATTLANYCYYYMFDGCSSLTTAPALPATTLADSCYYYMFNGCTSLTTAPELPAITLASYCYSYMFQNCSNLNYIKAMFTTTPSSSYTGNWVSRVASTGTFVKNSAATWDVTGTNGVPSGWTVQTASS